MQERSKVNAHGRDNPMGYKGQKSHVMQKCSCARNYYMKSESCSPFGLVVIIFMNRIIDLFD